MLQSDHLNSQRSKLCLTTKYFSIAKCFIVKYQMIFHHLLTFLPFLFQLHLVIPALKKSEKFKEEQSESE